MIYIFYTLITIWILSGLWLLISYLFTKNHNVNSHELSDVCDDDLIGK